MYKDKDVETAFKENDEEPEKGKDLGEPVYYTGQWGSDTTEASLAEIVKNVTYRYGEDVANDNAQYSLNTGSYDLDEDSGSFVLGNDGEKVTISGRSIGDINVQLILEKMGGGGHITLAGAQIEGMTIDEVKQELKQRISEYFEENSCQ